MDDYLFLRPNVQVEPLFDHWYVWSHLIPPATAARNVTERHLKIMDSYVGAAQIHANAVKNPKMAGGPFIDYGGKRVDEIRALRDATRQKYAHLLKLSGEISALDELLRNKATGFSMQGLYKEIPAVLRGYVELIYDLNNNASFRIIEPLLYRSKYYDRSAQSLMLSLVSGDDRPFVLSTPRLPSPEAYMIERSFDDPIVDQLFALKSSPQLWSFIRDLLDVPASQQELVRSFFTSVRPSPYQSYSGEGIRWRYFGHACILIESAGLTLLFDPVLSYTYESDVSRYTYEDLPERIDYVLITHNHQDHVLFETLLQIRHKVGHFVVPRSGGGALQDPSLKLILENSGCRNVIEICEMDSIRTSQGEILALPFFGEHADLNVQSKTAYLVRLGGHVLLFAADSCNIEPTLYQHLQNAIGDVDVLFLGMECDGAPLSWLYGPLLTRRIERSQDESRRLAGSDYDQAVDMVNRFSCKEAYVYAMGQEPWLNYVMSLKYTPESRPIVHSNQLIDYCKGRNICAERLFGEKEILID